MDIADGITIAQGSSTSVLIIPNDTMHYYIDSIVIDDEEIANYQNPTVFNPGADRTIRYVYDEDDNPVAQIGRFVYIDDTVPCHVIETFINIQYIYEDSGYYEEHILIYDEHGNSGVLTINGYGSRPIHISYNQLIAATYIWETYSDGKIHENPLRDVFGDDGMIREHNYFVS